jgi:hypothetical protein
LIELIAEAQLPSEKESLAFEAQLHQQFDQWRKPETEIFCFSTEQGPHAKAAMRHATTPGQLLGMACFAAIAEAMPEVARGSLVGAQ